jgi:hypothetical protein
MTDETDTVWVLSDDAGNYYVLGHATVEAARVPLADAAKLQALLAATAVQGYGGPRGSDEGQGIPRLSLVQPLPAGPVFSAGIQLPFLLR